VLVSLKPGLVDELKSLCAEAQIPLTRLGVVGQPDEPELHIAGQCIVPLEKIRQAWSATLPIAMGATEDRESELARS
jgi:hypothetical protein